MSFPRYPAYKNSGVEWLGEVPGHWDVKRLSMLASMIQTGPFGSQLHSSDYVDDGTPVINPSNIQDGKIEPDWSCAITPENVERLSQHKLAEGDIVFGRRGEMGRCALVSAHEVGWICGTGSLNVRLSDLAYPQFVSSYLRTEYVREWLKLQSVGSTMDNLNTQILGSISVPVPPTTEQTQIAAFLDRETAKIDGLVAEQRRLMELLKEKRQAVISHAVTQGLNPHAPMKPCGIEWLGDVPEHWEVKRLRDVVNLNPSKSEIATLERDSLVSFLPMSAIGEDGSLRLDSEKPIGELENGYTYFRDGDVTIAKITPCYENGKGALMRGLTQGVGFGTTELIVIRPMPEESCGKFLHYLFVSTVFRSIGESHMYGAGGQKRVPDDFVRNFATGFPPVQEQTVIATFLDEELAKLDTLTTEAQRAIDLLQERRTALISAAVTGQIDVRGLAAVATH